MEHEKFNLFKELKELFRKAKELDFKVTTVLMSVAVLQTLSWYFTSRRFFRRNIYQHFINDQYVNLYDYMYWLIGDFVTFFVLPVLIIKLILRDELKNYGVRLGDYKTGLKIAGLFLGVMLPILWIVSSWPSFIAVYPHLHLAKIDWKIFFLFEMSMLFYMFGWEYIWRGFMLFGLEKKFGYYAIFVQMIPFVILHNGKPQIETLGAIIAGIALGILAFRTRSFLYCVIVHFGVIFGIDLISTLRFRTGDYGLGFSSIYNLISSLF